MIVSLTLMVLVVLAALSQAVLSVGAIEPQAAANLMRGQRALYIAESGIERAFAQFVSTPNLITNARAATITLYTGVPMPDQSGTYTVTYQTRGFSTVLVRSTGVAAGGGTRNLAVSVTSNFISRRAILTNDDLAIGGSARVQGGEGGVHSNQDLTLSGNANIAQDATATEDYTAGNSTSVGGTTGGGKPTIAIPVIDPQAFLPSADYILEVASGRPQIREAVTGITHPNNWQGWSYNSRTRTWSNNNSTIPAGTYYADNASISITGSPGTVANPWRATLIAELDITLSGRPAMAPDQATSAEAADLLMVAGGDIRVTGTPGSQYTGVIAAHEQIDFSGNASLTGVVLAEDGAAVRTTVRSNALSGNVTITYNGGTRTPFTGPPQIVSWTLTP